MGAYNSKESPYYSWYTFYNWPNVYHSWWDFDTLPTVNKMDPAFIRYIITDEDSVLAHWLRLGADGYRLDVADELPDEFISLLRSRIKALKPDALLLGEVWEDASNKSAYGRRRTYFTGGELDSVMNYPLRTAILNFVKNLDGGRGFKETVMSILENYPPQVAACNMNLLGTHDTPRILTALVDDFDGPREEKAKRHLSRNQLPVATERLLMASFLQYTLPGSPSLYYADEAGMEGYRDPFNRRTYPWGREDPELLAHFRRLGQLRKNCDALRLGDIQFFQAEDRRIGFTRRYGDSVLKIYCNRCGDPWDIPAGKILLGHNLQTVAPDWLTLAPKGFCIVEGQRGNRKICIRLLPSAGREPHGGGYPGGRRSHRNGLLLWQLRLPKQLHHCQGNRPASRAINAQNGRPLNGGLPLLLGMVYFVATLTFSGLKEYPCFFMQ